MFGRFPTRIAANFLLVLWAGVFTTLGHAEPAGENGGCVCAIEVHSEAGDCDCEREGRCLGCSGCCEFAPTGASRPGLWRSANGGGLAAVDALPPVSLAAPESPSGVTLCAWLSSRTSKPFPGHSSPFSARPPPLL